MNEKQDLEAVIPVTVSYAEIEELRQFKKQHEASKKGRIALYVFFGTMLLSLANDVYMETQKVTRHKDVVMVQAPQGRGPHGFDATKFHSDKDFIAYTNGDNKKGDCDKKLIASKHDGAKEFHHTAEEKAAWAKLSEEERQAIKEAHHGKKKYHHTAEEKAAWKALSEEERQAIKAAHKAKHDKYTPEQRAAWAKLSDEERHAIKEAHKAEHKAKYESKYTPEQRAAWAKLSDEERHAIKEAHKAERKAKHESKYTPEQRAAWAKLSDEERHAIKAKKHHGNKQESIKDTVTNFLNSFVQQKNQVTADLI